MKRIFSQQNELIQFAERFLQERIQALDKDVKHCLTKPYAPFPAILFCFSTVDMLAALSAGDATKNAPTSKQSKSYMTSFMGYTHEQAELLMKIFRHKIVHLAVPKAITQHDNKHIAWRYFHEHSPQHLKLTKLSVSEKGTLSISSDLQIPYDHKFEISILDFVDDIKNSVYQPKGYLHKLKTTNDLQGRFEKAIQEIYQ